MALVDLKRNGDISVITLTGGITNPINLQTCTEFLNKLDIVSEQEKNVKGLKLTSANTKFFSIGFDLPRLLECDDDGIGEFYEAFNDVCIKLYSLPIPTVSAITGHFVAGGSIFAASADYRFLAEGKAKTGITAVKLGLHVPYPAQWIIQARLKADFANDMLRTGDFYDATWATDAGFIHELRPPENLQEYSDNVLTEITSKPNEEFVSAKMKKAEILRYDYNENKVEDMKKFVDSWFKPEVQEALKIATKKF